MLELPFIFWLWATSTSFVLLALLWAPLTRSSAPLVLPLVVPAGSTLVLHVDRVLTAEQRVTVRNIAAAWHKEHGVPVLVVDGAEWTVSATGAPE